MNNCPLCGSSKVIKLGALAGSRTGIKTPLNGCRKCFTLFQRPGYHEDEKALKRDLEFHVNKKNETEGYSKKIINKLLEINPSASTLLDIGCGIGATLLVGEKMGLRSSGVEVNPFACQYAKQHYDLDIMQGYFCPEHYSDGFDLIILDQVLEHVPHPQAFMAEVFSVLRNKGLLYFSVPGNKGGIIRVIFSLLFRGNVKSIFKDNDVHINHFFHKGIQYISDSNCAHIICKIESGRYIIQKGNID